MGYDILRPNCHESNRFNSGTGAPLSRILTEVRCTRLHAAKAGMECPYPPRSISTIVVGDLPGGLYWPGQMAIGPLPLFRSEASLYPVERFFVSLTRSSRLETLSRPPTSGALCWFVDRPFSFFLYFFLPKNDRVRGPYPHEARQGGGS